MHDIKTIVAMNAKRVDDIGNRPMRNTEVLRQIDQAKDLISIARKSQSNGIKEIHLGNAQRILEKIYGGL